MRLSRRAADLASAVPLWDPTTGSSAQDDNAEHDPSPGNPSGLDTTKVDFGPRASLASGHATRPKVHRCQSSEANAGELLAGGARIHVDFHAAGHFDDFR